MLTYLEFLHENEFKKEEHYSGGISHIHDGEVGGHKIRIHFDPKGKKEGHYEAAFRVNGSFSKHRGDIGAVVDHDGHKILHHVHRVIHKFIREKKPKALHMNAYDSNDESQSHKQKVYDRLAHTLVRHYGGHVERHMSQDGEEWPAAHFHESYVWYVHKEEFLEERTDAVEKAIKSYKGDGFHRMNTHGKGGHGKEVGHIANEIRNHRAAEDHVVYRGMGHTEKPEENADRETKHHFTHTRRDLTSTSTREDVAHSFAHHLNLGNETRRHMMKIHIPAGSHGMKVSDHEYLLHPGARFRTHKKPTEEEHDVTETMYDKHGKHVNTSKKKFTVWHSHLIHDGVRKTKYL